jgi:Protein of unknown function (DUF1566)
MTISKILGCASAFIAAASISAFGFAACSSSIGPVGNPGTWTADASGEILTYSGNGLSYTKCQLGTSGANCATGSVQTFTWRGALQASVAARIGGFDDWRLPNLQEAVALMEPTCNPALSAAFPAVSAGQQWTSTSYSVPNNTDGAWNINSFGGVASPILKSSLRSVLLVRGSSTPAGNFDSLPAANVTLTPSVATTGQAAPFDVVVSTGSPVAALLGVSLNVLTQPSGPTASLTGSVFCSISSGSSSCTVSGVQLSGPPGAYTLGASTAGGPSGGVTVNASPTIQLLSGPTASLSAPASATQFAPFNVVVTMTAPATADTTFELAPTGGPAGALGGSLFCTVPAAASTCTFTGVTFSGYGNGLAITAGSIAGPNTPVIGTTMDIVGVPIDIAMGSQATSQVGAAFNVIFNLSAAIPFPVTMTSQQVGGPVGTFTPASCTIAAGATFCAAPGNTFSATGILVMEPLLTMSGNVLIGTKTNATIDIVNQGATLSAPATVAQNTPFNVTLTLAAGELTDRTFTLSRASGPAGTLGGGLTCTVTAGNLSCTFTGVTFTGAGTALELTATVSTVPAIAVTNSFTDVTGVPLNYTISPITPPSVAINTPFNVTLQSSQPVAFDIPFTITLVNGTGGVLGGGTGCTILAGQTSCTVTGVTYSALGNITLIANTTVQGAAFAYEQGAINIVAAPIAPAAVAVPTLATKYMLLLCGLLGLMATMRRKRAT